MKYTDVDTLVKDMVLFCRTVRKERRSCNVCDYTVICDLFYDAPADFDLRCTHSGVYTRNTNVNR